MERFATNVEKMATALCKDAESRELSKLFETLESLRSAGADPRFIAALEKKLDRPLLLLAHATIFPSREAASAPAVGGVSSPTAPLPVASTTSGSMDLSESASDSFS